MYELHIPITAVIWHLNSHFNFFLSIHSCCRIVCNTLVLEEGLICGDDIGGDICNFREHLAFGVVHKWHTVKIGRGTLKSDIMSIDQAIFFDEGAPLKVCDTDSSQISYTEGPEVHIKCLSMKEICLEIPM